MNTFVMPGLAVSMILLAGCRTHKEMQPDPILAGIVIGKTTRMEVQALLGTPDESTHDAIGRTTFYYRRQLPARHRNRLFNSLDLLTDDFETQREKVTTIYFGPDEVVSSVTSKIKNKETPTDSF